MPLKPRRRSSSTGSLALDADSSFAIGEIEAWALARSVAPLLGVDEAGKGPLAGPVVAGAVILPEDHQLDGLRDSKILSAAGRDAFFPRIQAVAIGYGVGVVSADEIDRVGIQPATHAAMRAAIELATAGGIRPALVVVDGKIAIPDLSYPQRTVIKGDDRSFAVAAASVLAKVTRDRLMVAFDEQYPGYGFAVHKGYGTALHLARLREHGPCAIHRLCFRGVVQPATLAPIDDAKPNEPVDKVERVG